MDAMASSLLASILVVLLAHPGSVASDPTDAAAAALVERFETVFKADGRLLAASPSTYGQLSEDDSGALRAPLGLLLAGLESLHKEAADNMIRRAEAVLVGAKDFHLPKGRGFVRSRRCYVLVLPSASAFEIRELFSGKEATPTGGLPVWKWSAPIGEFGEGDPKPSTLYASQVGSSFVLFANNLEDLRATAEQLNSGRAPHEILVALRGFGLLSNQETWGYRRYRPQGKEDKVAAGTVPITRGAEALTFFVDSQRKICVVTLYSSPKDEGTAFNISSDIYMPRMKPIGSGVWEVTFPLAGDEDSFERLLYVMGLFGFGVFA